MKWVPVFKSSAEPLAVSMTGVKLGDRLLVLGCSEPVLIARLAVKTGFTGRAMALDEREPLVARAADVAGREGALIETASAPWRALPLDPNSFDVTVIYDVLPYLSAGERLGCVAEVVRVLRPGGRCLVIDAALRGGLSTLIHRRSSHPDYAAGGGAVAPLQSSGVRAVRMLAEREGLVFVEGVKANT
jgi:ubiquinone/menaquinone biosynthesis C-methylase UbiE